MEDMAGKRDFLSLTVTIVEKDTVTDSLTDLDKWETFEDWAVRQLLLQRHPDLDQCRTAWTKLIKDPTETITKGRDGQWLLGRYVGKVGAHVVAASTETAVVRSKVVDDSDCLDAMLERCDEHLEKRRKMCFVEQAFSSGSLKPPAVDDWEAENIADNCIGLNVFGRRAGHRDLQRAAALQFNQNQAIEESLKGEPEEAVNKRPKPAAAADLSSLRLGLEVCQHEMLAKLDQALLKYRASVLTLQASVANTRAACVLCRPPEEDMFQDLDTSVSRLTVSLLSADTRKQKFQKVVNELYKEANCVDSVKTAEKSIKGTLADFSTCPEIKEMKAELKTLQKWQSDALRINDKANKAKLKAVASKRTMQNVPAVANVPDICENMHVHFELDSAKCIAEASIDVGLVRKGRAVFFPSDKLLTCMAEPIVKMSYYEAQKTWVHQHLMSSGLSVGAASIMRDAVQKTIRQLIVTNCDTVLQAAMPHTSEDDWVKEAFELQFFMVLSGHGSIEPSPLCLPEVRLCLEGGFLMFGILATECVGVTWYDKSEWLSKLSADQFLGIARVHGFAVKMEPGSFITVPTGHLIGTCRLTNRAEFKSMKKGCATGLQMLGFGHEISRWLGPDSWERLGSALLTIEVPSDSLVWDARKVWSVGGWWHVGAD